MQIKKGKITLILDLYFFNINSLNNLNHIHEPKNYQIFGLFPWLFSVILILFLH